MPCFLTFVFPFQSSKSVALPLMALIIKISYLILFAAQDRAGVFCNFKNFSSYHDKTPLLSITKVLFWGFTCKIQTTWFFK